MTPMTSAAASPMVPARAGMTMAPYLRCRHSGSRRADTDPVWLRYTNPAVAARFQELLPGCNLAAATQDRWSGGGTGSRVLNGQLAGDFHRWYPGVTRASDPTRLAA